MLPNKEVSGNPDVFHGRSRMKSALLPDSLPITNGSVQSRANEYPASLIDVPKLRPTDLWSQQKGGAPELERLAESNYRSIERLANRVLQLQKVVRVLAERDCEGSRDLLENLVKQAEYSSRPPSRSEPIQDPGDSYPARGSGEARSTLRMKLLDEAQMENVILTQTIEDYDHTLRLTMNKYRELLSQIETQRQQYRVDLEEVLRKSEERARDLEEENVFLRARVDRIIGGLREALREGISEDKEVVSVLALVLKENEGLRKVLGGL